MSHIALLKALRRPASAPLEHRPPAHATSTQARPASGAGARTPQRRCPVRVASPGATPGKLLRRAGRSARIGTPACLAPSDGIIAARPLTSTAAARRHGRAAAARHRTAGSIFPGRRSMIAVNRPRKPARSTQSGTRRSSTSLSLARVPHGAGAHYALRIPFAARRASSLEGSSDNIPYHRERKHE